MDVVRQRPLVRSNLKKPAVLGLLVAALLSSALVLVSRLSRGAAAPTVERSSIWTDHVRRGDLLRQVPTQGALVPEHVRWLSATSAGQIANIAVRPGAEVEPDTVIAVLANADLELAALEAERHAASAEAAMIQLDVRTSADSKVLGSTLSTLHAELADAERHATSADKLSREGLMGTLERDDALAKAKGLTTRVRGEEDHLRLLDAGRGRQLAAQRAELERLREIAAFARRRLDSLTVRAGIRGVVQDIPLEQGQWVAIGTVLAKVAEPGRLKGEVRVSEAEAADVHRGLPVRFEWGSGVVLRGHIERVDPAVAKGSVRLEVTIDDTLPQGARADQTVSGYIEIEKLKDVLFVSRPAGARDRAPLQVFRLDASRARASRVPVQLGRGSAREIEIAGGLAEGDEIITSDVSAPEGAIDIRLK